MAEVGERDVLEQPLLAVAPVQPGQHQQAEQQGQHGERLEVVGHPAARDQGRRRLRTRGRRRRAAAARGRRPPRRRRPCRRRTRSRAAGRAPASAAGGRALRSATSTVSSPPIPGNASSRSTTTVVDVEGVALRRAGRCVGHVVAVADDEHRDLRAVGGQLGQHVVEVAAAGEARRPERRPAERVGVHGDQPVAGPAVDGRHASAAPGWSGPRARRAGRTTRRRSARRRSPRRPSRPPCR